MDKTPMLGVGSDAVLKALSTVVRKPPRNSNSTKSATVPVARSSRVDKLPANNESCILGMDSESVLATLASVVRKPKPATPMASSFNGNWTSTFDANRSFSGLNNDSFRASLPPRINNSSMFDNVTILQHRYEQPNATISPSTKQVLPINTITLNESTMNNQYMPKRQERVQYCQSITEMQAKVGDKRDVRLEIKRPEKKSAQTVRNPASNSQMQTVVIDYWFNDGVRSENELIKYINKAVKTIKIGMAMLLNKKVATQLSVAVRRGVAVQLLFDLKKACDNGMEWAKELLQKGIQLCHSTVTFEWNIAVFDAQILIQSSQNAAKCDFEVFNLVYTMVYTGSIAFAFDTQFDRMWQAAVKNIQNDKQETERKPGNKRKRICFPTTLAFLDMLGA